MLLIHITLGVALLLACAWALRRAWRSFVLEMEGYELGDDAGYIRERRCKSRERREALTKHSMHLAKCGAGYLKRLRSGDCSHSA